MPRDRQALPEMRRRVDDARVRQSPTDGGAGRFRPCRLLRAAPIRRNLQGASFLHAAALHHGTLMSEGM
jgi:hypothetical protein